MKTIHAEENQDGTYSVTISNQSTKSRMSGKAEVKEIIDSRIVISRAEIKITAYPNDRNDEEMLKLEVKEGA